MTLPETVTSVGEYAFDGCQALTDINLSSGITKIGAFAFTDCSNLSVSLPEGLTFLGTMAFNGCKIPDLVVPAGLVSIHARAFQGAEIQTISVKAGNPVYDSRDNCNAVVETTSDKLVTACNATSIPTSVKSIGPFSFTSAGNLSALTVPYGVTAIESNAFQSCSKLETNLLPCSVTSIGSKAFFNCSRLSTLITEAVVPPSAGTEFLAYTRSDLKIWTSPHCDTEYSAASGWSGYSIESLSSLNDSQLMPSGLSSINTGTYMGRVTGQLTVSHVRSLENLAGCDYSGYALMQGKLRYLDMKSASMSGSPYDEDDAYSSSDSSKAARANAFDSGIFYRCNQLNTIVLPSSVDVISQGAFNQCARLEAVYMSGVSSISESFSGCSSLKHIFIDGETPPSIDSRTLQNIPASCTIHVPKGKSSVYIASSWKTFATTVEMN